MARGGGGGGARARVLYSATPHGRPAGLVTSCAARLPLPPPLALHPPAVAFLRLLLVYACAA